MTVKVKNGHAALRQPPFSDDGIDKARLSAREQLLI
jgi:hypothetical protein